MKQIVLAGGCFWCLDAVYRRLRGVTEVESGYAGGSGTPSYDAVASGKTGHAETVRISFDEDTIPADVILDLYFLIHDPTTLNRQGADIGTQYRSVMFYQDDEQKEQFQAARDRAAKLWTDPIVTEIIPLTEFFVAEEEHQDFFNKNPDSGYCSVVIQPKIVKARSAFTTWFKEES